MSFKEHGIKHERSQGLIDYAYRYARNAHEGQERKYTGGPYIVHPVAVAQTVASVTDHCEMIAAALLHDTVEDTRVTLSDIWDCFGYGVTRLVQQLTDVSVPEDGNRAVRKHIDRMHYEDASHEAKTIKLADLIDNTRSICIDDPNFAPLYMREKDLMLPYLRGGDTSLFLRARGLVDAYLGGAT